MHDAARPTADHWQPSPFREFVLKIHSRCDLACDYCYMYAMADQSWRGRPRQMADTIAARAADRIGEHVRQHGLAEISLVLHGGEPLLAGPGFIAWLTRRVRDAVGVPVDASVQTNGTRLDEEILKCFSRLGIQVGVSLDGAPQAHDRHRRFPNGLGSHAAVAAGLDLLGSARYRHLFSGLLCVVDLHNDPAATYQALLEFRPPRIDFLLPHATWDSPPPRRSASSTDTPYAEWLIAIFDRWYPDPRTDVRLFSDIMRLLLGRPSYSEAVGLAPSGVVVIETDGEIEQVDTLKAAFPGAPHTGLHVMRDSFDTALMLPAIAARQRGADALCATCRQCELHRICGGGTYAHRYRKGTGFANPSVYCPDLTRLIEHIRRTMYNDITERLILRAAR